MATITLRSGRTVVATLTLRGDGQDERRLHDAWLAAAEVGTVITHLDLDSSAGNKNGSSDVVVVSPQQPGPTGPEH